MAGTDQVYRVGISGSYGGLNLGDEAILESIVSQLRHSLKVEITVFSRNAQDTRDRHTVDRVIPIRDLSREEARAEVQSLDVFVLGGGGILYDKEAKLYLREVLLAHEMNVPVMVYAVSAGPLAQTSSRNAVRDALQPVSVLTVRDRRGAHLLEEVGVHRPIEVTADPAALVEPKSIEPSHLQQEGLSDRRRRVGFSVREPGPAAPDMDVNHYHQLLANAADFMVDRLEADIVFVPMERKRMDIQHSHAVVSKMQCADRATVLRGDYSPGQVLSLIGNFQFAVGMRLHFLLFAAIQGVPFVALPYAAKVSGLLQGLELEMPSLEDVNTGRLLATIDRSWDLRHRMHEHILDRLPELKDRARMNNQLLVELLTRQPARTS